MIPLKRRIGARILEVRRDRHLSQAALAEAAGVSTNHISLIERGQRCPSLEVLEAIARALHHPLHRLFTQEGEPAGVEQVERELGQLTAYLVTRGPRDIRKIHEIARQVLDG